MTEGRHLGQVGKPRAERTETFDYLDCAKPLRVHPNLTNLLIVGFLDEAAKIDVTDVQRAMTKISDFFRSVVHPDDYDTFWAAAIRNRQRVEDLLETVFVLVEGLADRPTRRRSASSAGRRKTAANSRGDSSLRAMRQLEKQGRPDLALIVDQARHAQQTG